VAAETVAGSPAWQWSLAVFVLFLGLVVLIACWWIGDVGLTTKIILTAIYLASFGLLFIPNWSFLFIVVQCIFILIVGAMTFGTSWLKRNFRD
jgi:hypothetical protein